MVFFGCALSLACKDILFSLLFRYGICFTQIIFYTGLSCLFFSLLHFCVSKQKMWCRDLKLQCKRVFWVSISSIFAFAVFKYLSPTIISIGVKMTFPLLVILSRFLKTDYSGKERLVAWGTICVLFLFFILTIREGADLFGLTLLGLAILSMVGEFQTLSFSIHADNPALVCFAPSFGLVLVGLLLAGIGQGDISFPALMEGSMLFVCGLCLFFIYYTAKSRYTLLPPGLAEYPTLLATLFVWPVDAYFLGSIISERVLLTGFIAIIMMAFLLYIRHQRLSCT